MDDVRANGLCSYGCLLPACTTACVDLLAGGSLAASWSLSQLFLVPCVLVSAHEKVEALARVSPSGAVSLPGCDLWFPGFLSPFVD